MDSSNRIGHSCWYREFLERKFTPWRQGYLRAWSTDYDEHETGPGLYPVGVVEDKETQRTRSVHVHFISFAESCPEE